MLAPPPRPLVLLVDDEPMIRELGRTVLEQEGFTVVTADDGDTGVAAYAAHRPALVVMDVTMPRMSGREAFLRIRALDPAARVLLSTGYTTEDLASLTDLVGMLPKPYRPVELLAAVQNALPGATQ
ncbi:MAG TPA: response regulator [Urbifossiella sp.]|nr:response regulator [Urbifossiella sp.]